MKEIKTEIINTTREIADLVDWLIFRHASPELLKPTMYIDLEGVDLCREGSVSILTLLIDTGISVTTRVCLIDVHLLGLQAFNTTGIKQKTLKDILQDEKIPKVFFDVRNDADALFAHFGVALQGVMDIQLMESAKRTTTGSRKYLTGLSKCVEKRAFSDQASWKLAKEKGERLFKPEHGGSFEVFNLRPIPKDIVSYCVGDVQCLPKLWETLWKPATVKWRDLVNYETKKRVEASQKPEYQPHGPNMALAPWNKDQNKALDEWNYVPTLDDFLDDLNEPESWDQYDELQLAVGI
ncbi:hypothetical protein VE03_02086 [Pseudogymnoascus sp. 23342-1-I1]|nr:hypothetical protein VE03_02086 [Pseudogymnoascus sp. 23342-1-I1]